MVLNATLVDKQNMTCDLVAPLVPKEAQDAAEMRKGGVRDSRQGTKHRKFLCWKEHVE